MEMLALEPDRARRPYLSDNVKAFFEARHPPREVKAERREFLFDARFGIAGPRTQDHPAFGQVVKRRPLHREVQGISQRGHERRCAQPDM